MESLIGSAIVFSRGTEENLNSIARPRSSALLKVAFFLPKSLAAGSFGSVLIIYVMRYRKRIIGSMKAGTFWECRYEDLCEACFKVLQPIEIRALVTFGG